jgi:uncharacterized protein YeaO (DUF488 family)
MTLRVVRLGTPRQTGEGLRIGTVRRPPRGVPKARLGEWYDLWLPQLAPSAELVKLGLAARSPRDWEKFVRKYRAEMAKPDNARLIALLAALSQTADFAVGCYCEDPAYCHRSVLRELLVESGARVIL